MAHYKHYRSFVPGNTPDLNVLQVGEIALNITDRNIFTKNSAGDLVTLYSPTASGGSIGDPDTIKTILLKGSTAQWNAYSGTEGQIGYDSQADTLLVYNYDGTGSGAYIRLAREDHVHNLDNLTDVNLVAQAPVSGNALVYNGSEWRPGVPGAATKLNSAVTISISGAVSGSASFDGSAPITISTIIDPASPSFPKATTTSYGAVRVPSGSGINVVSGDISLTPATSSQIGGIKPGTGLSVDGAGYVTVNASQVDYNSLANKPTLGSMASQNANSVAITGGSVTAGTLSSSNVTLTGGSITNVTERLYEYTSAASTTLTNGEWYVHNTTANVTVNLPGSPVAGTRVKVTRWQADNTYTTTIGGNGQNIMGLNEAMTFDVNKVTATFVFKDSTIGWAIM